MISEFDIWRAANLMIQEHGADAEFEACRMADRLLGWGDHGGQLVWLRIRRAIAEVQALSHYRTVTRL